MAPGGARPDRPPVEIPRADPQPFASVATHSLSTLTNLLTVSLAMPRGRARPEMAEIGKRTFPVHLGARKHTILCARGGMGNAAYPPACTQISKENNTTHTSAPESPQIRSCVGRSWKQNVKFVEKWSRPTFGEVDGDGWVNRHLASWPAAHSGGPPGRRPQAPGRRASGPHPAPRRPKRARHPAHAAVGPFQLRDNILGVHPVFAGLRRHFVLRHIDPGGTKGGAARRIRGLHWPAPKPA